jgi:hypothetical protein
LSFFPTPWPFYARCVGWFAAGGVLAFHEASFAPFLLLSAHLPLWSSCASLICEIIQRSGANTEIGLALYRMFQEADLPAPTMHMEMLLGSDPDLIQWMYDMVRSLWPQTRQFGLSLEKIGDLDTLQMRLQAEVTGSNTVVTWPANVGVWVRKPTDQASR